MDYLYEIAKELSQNSKRCRYVSPTSRFDQYVILQKKTEFETGNDIMDSIRSNLAILDKKLWNRSADQRAVHKELMASRAEFIYKGAFRTHEKQIREYNDFPNVKTATALTAPRQLGKTTCFALYSTAEFMSVPGSRIVIVANAARSAGKDSGMLYLIREMLLKGFGITKKDCKEGYNSSTIACRFGNEVRSISSYSSKSKDR